MSNTVIVKKSSVAGKIPIASDLQPAELAVNLVDQKLYSKRTDGTVVLVGVGSTIINPTLNRFSGTGSQTDFTLAAAPVSATALIVNISGVVQTPTVDYTVSGTTLTFTTAPPAGTNNITVQNLGTAGVINVPLDGSVTAASMAPGAAVGNIGFTPYNATNPSGFITSSASITGNAATATKLQTARTINGVSFDGSANITVADSTKLPTAGGTMTGAITFAAGQTWPTINQSTTGNAATATKLQTARTIGGVSFDGSANINLPGVNAAGNQNTTGSSASCTGNAATATKLQTARTINGVSFDGSADITVSGVPPGTIIMFASSTAPTGWLKANGAAISRTTYAALFAAIGTIFGAGDGSTTFNLPDMRGYFPRGWDDGRGVDSGRLFGSNQGFAMQHHRHAHGTDGSPCGGYNTNGYQDSIGTTMGSGNQSGGPGYSNSTTSAMMPITAGGTSVSGAAETRPVNMALLFCIKY